MIHPFVNDCLFARAVEVKKCVGVIRRCALRQPQATGRVRRQCALDFGPAAKEAALP